MPASAKRVLIFTAFGTHTVHNQFDAVVGASLAARGAEVAALLCDGLYPDCHTLQWLDPSERQTACANCAFRSKSLFDAFSLPTMQMRSYLQDGDRSEIEQWIATVPPSEYATARFQGASIGEWITPAVHSRFRVKSHDLSRPDIQKVHRQYLVDGALSYLLISRCLDSWRPSHMILWGAWLVAYRVAFEVARSRGIDTVAHERGNNEVTPGGTFSVDANMVTALVRNPKKTGRVWRDIPLTSEELTQAQSFFFNKEKEGGGGFYSYETAYSSVRAKLHLPDDAKIVGIFTSSEYELSTHPDFMHAPEQLDIIDRLIELFRDKGYYLVVRHHPNIGRFHRGRSEVDFISRAYRQALRAPDYVRVVMPHETLTSYALFWHLDAAISLFSTVGIEACARGVPTAYLDLSIYGGGVPFTIGSDFREGGLESVVQGLVEHSDRFGIEDLRRLYRYTHSTMFRLCRQFRSFDMGSGSEANIKVTSLEQLLPGHDRELDRVCDHVLHGTPLEPYPEPHHWDRTEEAEDEFLAQEWKRLRHTRQEVRRVGATEMKRSTGDRIGVLRVGYGSDLRAQERCAGWRRVSRWQRFFDCGFVAPRISPRATLESIVERLEEAKDAFIAIVPDHVHYDGAFFALLHEVLTEKEGLWSASLGGWIASDEEIDRAVFNPETPRPSWSDLAQVSPVLHRVEYLLAFGLFRREPLLAGLRHLLESTFDTELPEGLYSWLMRDENERQARPLLVLFEGAVRETSETRIVEMENDQTDSLGRASKIGQLFL